MAEREFNMVDVTSENIAAVGYHAESKTLRVTFKKNGLTYEYRGVSQRLYDDLLGADSVGSFFHQNIRSEFPYSKV